MVLKVKESNMSEQLNLLGKLLPGEYYVPLSEEIIAGKIKLELMFYNIAFYWGDGKVVAANMPLSTPSLKSFVEGDPNLATSKFEMLKLYKELAQEYGAPLPLVTASAYAAVMQAITKSKTSEMKKISASYVKPKIKFPNAILGNDVTEEQTHKKMAMLTEMAMTTKGFPPKPFLPEDYGSLIKPPTAPLFSDEVKTAKSATKTKFVGSGTPIQLKDATKLGQRVKGTSPDSKYYLVARNDHIKVAIRNRKSNGSVSFRVETFGFVPSDDLEKLEKSGLTQNKTSEVSYYSAHLGLTTSDGTHLAVGRLVGSFLLGLGLKFDQMILNVDDIPEDK